MKTKLKNLFTSYWEYMLLVTACKCGIFETIKAGSTTCKEIAAKGNLNDSVLSDLLNALVMGGYLMKENGQYSLTKSGELLLAEEPDSLHYACLHWAGEHLDSWRHMEYTLRTGKPAFEYLYSDRFFNYLAGDPAKVHAYQKAMYEYAIDDYSGICDCITFERYNSIADVGGGLGALISHIANRYPEKECILFDRPEVISIAKDAGYRAIGGDFFQEIPFQTDAVILSRVLHDWDNATCAILLANIQKSILPNGNLIVIENLKEKINDGAALLNLNMKLITDSQERTYNEYKFLLHQAGFNIAECKKLNEFQYVLVCAVIN